MVPLENLVNYKALAHKLTHKFNVLTIECNHQRSSQLSKWLRKAVVSFIFNRYTHRVHTAIKNQSPSPERSRVTGGQDLQMGLCREASQMMFYSLKVFLGCQRKTTHTNTASPI